MIQQLAGGETVSMMVERAGEARELSFWRCSVITVPCARSWWRTRLGLGSSWRSPESSRRWTSSHPADHHVQIGTVIAWYGTPWLVFPCVRSRRQWSISDPSKSCHHEPELAAPAYSTVRNRRDQEGMPTARDGEAGQTATR
jgi:hypothetical protein